MRICFDSLDAGPQTLTSQLLSSHPRACLQKLIYHSWELYDASGPSESEDGSNNEDAAAGRAGRRGIGRGGGRGCGGGGGVSDAVHPEPVSPRMSARTPQMPPTTRLVPNPMIPSRAATTTTTSTAGTSITFMEMHCASLAAKLIALQRASMCSLQPSARCMSGTHHPRICCLISVSLR